MLPKGDQALVPYRDVVGFTEARSRLGQGVHPRHLRYLERQQYYEKHCVSWASFNSANKVSGPKLP